MSWICGVIGFPESNLKQKICDDFEKPIFQIEEKELFIIAGGHSKTCLFYNSENDTKNIVLGLGIKEINNSYKIANIDDWKNTSDNEIKNKWNGHFIKISIGTDFINFFCDEIGLRDLFFYKISDNCYIFTTNQGKLSKICNIPIDYYEFASRWILTQQITNNSILKNVIRLNQGKELYFDRKTFDYKLSKTNWLPNITSNFLEDDFFENELEKLITFGANTDSNSELILSFSGGFDSRLIISFLEKDIKTFTFGKEYFSDVKIVKQICNSLNIENELIFYEIPEKEQLLKEIIEYSNQLCISRQMSEYLQQRNYLHFKDLDCINIDGCWGEIWRRAFFYKLFYTGKRDLLSKNYAQIWKYLLSRKADIFNDEINDLMEKAAKVQTEEMLLSLPDINVIGIDNFIDIFAIKTRLLNDVASEQARIDNILITFMPFVQKSLLNMLFQIRANSRRNSKMFRRIIKKRNRELTKFPLVKGNFQHPFGLNTFLVKIIKVINQKFNLNRKNAYPQEHSKIVIDTLKEYILDLLNSQKVKQNAYYRQSKIDELTSKLHTNNLTPKDYGELDWWLSLETMNL